MVWSGAGRHIIRKGASWGGWARDGEEMRRCWWWAASLVVLSTRVDYIVITLPANQYSSAKGRRTFLASKWVPLTNLIQHQVRSSSCWASGGVKAVKWKTQVGDNNNEMRRRSRRRQLGGNDDHSEEFLSFLEEYNIQLQYSSLYRRTSWRSTDLRCHQC